MTYEYKCVNCGYYENELDDYILNDENVTIDDLNCHIGNSYGLLCLDCYHDFKEDR